MTEDESVEWLEKHLQEALTSLMDKPLRYDESGIDLLTKAVGEFLVDKLSMDWEDHIELALQTNQETGDVKFAFKAKDAVGAALLESLSMESLPAAPPD